MMFQDARAPGRLTVLRQDGGANVADHGTARAVLEAALGGTFDLTAGQLARIFPDSDGVRPATVLMA